MSGELAQLQGKLKHARSLLEYHKHQADQNNALADRWFEEVASLEEDIERLDEYSVGTIAVARECGYNVTIVKVEKIAEGTSDYDDRVASEKSQWVSIYGDFSGSAFPTLKDVRYRFPAVKIIYTPSD